MQAVILFTVILVAATVRGLPLQMLTEDYPPYNYKDKGKITGVGMEVLQATLKELNMQADIKLWPWLGPMKRPCGQRMF